MRLAVYAQQRAVRVEDSRRVVQTVAVPLVKAHRQHHAQLPCQRGQTRHGCVLLRRPRVLIVAVLPFLTKIRALEQLGQQDDLRAFGRRLPNQPLGRLQVGSGVRDASHLNRSRLDFSHTVGTPFGICCVMQWMFPPPSRMSCA